ncbi:hypothetical protein D3C87_1077190 [compost metagenome]
MLLDADIHHTTVHAGEFKLHAVNGAGVDVADVDLRTDFMKRLGDDRTDAGCAPGDHHLQTRRRCQQINNLHDALLLFSHRLRHQNRFGIDRFGQQRHQQQPQNRGAHDHVET